MGATHSLTAAAICPKIRTRMGNGPAEPGRRPKMKFSEKELDDIAHHLQVAAGRYEDDAGKVCVSRVADQFRRQAKSAMALAERIHRREDDEELLTIEEASDYTAGRKPRRIKCTDSLGNVAYL